MIIFSTNILTLQFLCRRNISWLDLDPGFGNGFSWHGDGQISNHENMEKNRMKNATETETRY